MSTLKMLLTAVSITALGGLASSDAGAAASAGALMPKKMLPQALTNGTCSILSLRTGDYDYKSKGTISVQQLTTPDGMKHCYLQYVPQSAYTNYQGTNKKAPVVILLHGGNDNYVGALQPAGSYPLTGASSSVWVTEKDTDLLDSVAVANGAIVLVPNGVKDDDTTDGAPSATTTTQHWNDCSGFNPGYAKSGTAVSGSYQLALWADGHNYLPNAATYTKVDDVQFIKSMIANVTTNVSVVVKGQTQNVPIDTTRIYAVGASNGSNMAMRLAREDSGQIAAIAASLGGDAAVGGTKHTDGTYTLDASSTYQNSASDTCVDPTNLDPVPAMLIKGAPAPNNYVIGNTTGDAATSGDNYIPFNGGCGYDSNSSTVKSYGCWLPYDANDPYNPASAQFGYNTMNQTSAPTTLGNWLVRNKLTNVTPSYPLLANGDSNQTDGWVYNTTPTTIDSKVGTGITGKAAWGRCTDYNHAHGNELMYCVVHRNGHVDPSKATAIANYEQTFGNQNQDFETAKEEWNFLSSHYVAAGVPH